MKKTTWKYPLEITDEQNLMMPEGAEILTAQMQGGTLCLWARKYIATAQMAGGTLIWHVFERP